MEVKIKEMKKIEAGSGEKGLMVIARLGNENMRREILSGGKGDMDRGGFYVGRKE